jgi:bifunctional DNase/RNase
MQGSATNLIELEITKLSKSREQTWWEKFRKGIKPYRYAVVLEKVSAPEDYMVIIMGEAETQLLMFALDVAAGRIPVHTKTARFLHDSLKEAYERFGYHLEKVIIDKLVNEIFSATMYFKNGETLIMEEARASDALTIAVKCKKPIYVAEEILRDTNYNNSTGAKLLIFNSLNCEFYVRGWYFLCNTICVLLINSAL